MGDKRAEYPCGEAKLYSYINQNIIYPKKAIKNHVEGIVTICLDINENGKSENLIVIHDLGYSCAEEVIRVLKFMKK